MVVAGALAIFALILFLRRDYDMAFVATALGAVAWFLSYRVQIRKLVIENEPQEDPDDGLEEDEDD